MNQLNLDEKEKELYEYAGDDRIISSHELAESLKDEVEANYSFATGIPTLDRILGKVESGELITVTGPTGHGKTTLLMTITENMAKNEIKSVWFSLEVTPRQFIQKLMSGGKILPLFWIPAKNTPNNVQWLIERIIEANVKFNTKVVFIDHLHQTLALDKFNGKNLSLEIGDIISAIKHIAVDFGIVIFLVAHSTDDKSATTREPKMMDVRDSGMITRLADTVLGVWRISNTNNGKSTVMDDIEEGDNRTKVKIWKNRRNGTLGYFLMKHQDHSLEELEKEEIDSTAVPAKETKGRKNKTDAGWDPWTNT
jgi:replicative DNA helicase